MCLETGYTNLNSMWPYVSHCRYRLQQVVGHRGSLYTAYGIPEACNFQSNLDQNPITIEHNLKMVFSGMEPNADLNFVQLYATTSHCHVGNTSKHPVSRIIATCGLHNPQHSQSLLKHAKDYVDYMRNLADKTKCRVYTRMEAVFLLKDNIPEKIEARDFYEEDDIYALLQDFPMVLSLTLWSLRCFLGPGGILTCSDICAFFSYL